MRKLALAALLVAALLVAADRVTLHVAEGKIADRLAASQDLAGQPDVTIHGFPFLTQAIGGRYDDIEVGVRGLRRGDVRIASLDVHLRGVAIALSDVLGNDVSAVPVRRTDGRAVFAYADIDALLADRGLSVAPAGDLLRVTGEFGVLGRRVPVSAAGRVSASNGAVTVVASNFSADGVDVPAGALARAVGHRLDFTIHPGRLPFDLTLRSVAVTPAGIAVAATAEHLVLHA